MLVRTFLSAGIDTTIFVILSSRFRALAESPQAWAALRDDPQLARKAFEEGLRWNATSPYMDAPLHDTTLGEAKVLADEKSMNLAAANRDPRRWRPQQVRPGAGPLRTPRFRHRGPRLRGSDDGQDGSHLPPEGVGAASGPSSPPVGRSASTPTGSVGRSQPMSVTLR